jgi:uncharacterized repeat protein (TIGR02543 family)
MEKCKNYIFAIIALAAFAITACNFSLVGGLPTVPGQPLNLNAASSYRTVRITWEDPYCDGGCEIIKFQVAIVDICTEDTEDTDIHLYSHGLQRSTNGDITWVLADSNSSHTFIDLVNYVYYTFKVRAVNSVGYNISYLVAKPISSISNGDPPPRFTVSFDSQGGSYVAPITNVASGATINAPPEPTRAEHGFYAWYRDAAVSTRWNFATDRVTDHITLYARWVRNYLTVILSIEQITNPSFPIPGDITISRTGTNYNKTAVVSVTESDFDAGSINWTLTGVGNHSGQTFTSPGASITLDAEDPRYNSTGVHILVLEVGMGGISYRRNIFFTITN